jgi:head-tail adaptor
MKKRFPAGRRKRWGVFEILSAQNDSDGILREDWLPAFAVGNRMPVEITPMSAREVIDSQAKQSKVTHRLKASYRRELEDDGAVMRFVETRIINGVAHSTVYNIEGAIPDPDSGFSFITLLASSGISQEGN